MSRLVFSNPGQPVIRSSVHSVTQLCDQARAVRHRALLVIENSPVDYLRSVAAMVDAPYVAPDDSADRSDRITGLLGREFPILIHETDEPVDAGLLAALAGTVRAGGILVLGVPFSLCSPEVNTIARPMGRFTRRLAKILLHSAGRHADRIKVVNGADFSLTTAESAGDDSVLARQLIASGIRGRSMAELDLPDDSAVSEQDALLQAAVRHLQDHPRGCITITGRRGRGKSFLLGRISHCLRQQGITVAMTAARRSALQSVEKQGVDIPFLAAEEALHSGRSALLVDEAASLPLDTLSRYLAAHEQVIYCTTVEGYEQAGRAFDIRFSEMLRQQPREVLHLHPRTAWRWNPGDPLEDFLDRLLLAQQIDTSGAGPETQGEHDTALYRRPERDPESRQEIRDTGRLVRRVDRSELARNEPLLTDVYSLLRDSHYQTSASDIAHLLDGPDLQIWVLEEQGQISAALLLALEGKMDISLHEAVVGKQRRLPHQLLPQLLAQSANQAAPLSAGMGRVIRIAVHPGKRRQGRGSLLLQELTRTIAPPNGLMSAIGASFAGDSGKLEFWTANGFTRFHTGFRTNPRTGTQAVAVLKAFDAAVLDALLEASRIHDDNQGWLQGTARSTVKDAMDVPLLHRFANSQRSLNDTFAALSRLALQHPMTLAIPDGTSRRKHEAALRARVQSLLQSDHQHLRNNN